MAPHLPPFLQRLTPWPQKVLKHTAIFSADIVVYSGLMDEDEAETLKTWAINKRIISNSLQQLWAGLVNAPSRASCRAYRAPEDAV